MAVSTTTASELTQEQVQKILVRPLEQASVFLAAGPRIFDTDGNTVRIPKLGAPVDVAWVGENELIPEADVNFDEVALMPSTMKSLKVLTRFSNELARQSVISLDAALRDRLVTDVASKIDAQFLSASGDGITTPRGIFAQPGIQNVAVTGAITLDHLHDAWALALAKNVNMTGLRWVFTPNTFSKLRKLKDGQGRYQMQPDPTADGVFRLLGAPVVISSRVPNTTGATPTGRAALIDFSQVAVARDMAPSVKVLDQTFGNYDQQAIRVVARYDMGLLNAEAVVALNGITV